MNKHTETNINVKGTVAPDEIENPMQERHIGEIAELVEATVEDILTARRLDAQDDAGPVFVP